MNVRVLFFASLRERLHCRERSCAVPDGATVDDLWQVLCGEHPQIEPLARSIRVAVNREYVKGDQVLADNDEVALIPPVSGG